MRQVKRILTKLLNLIEATIDVVHDEITSPAEETEKSNKSVVTGDTDKKE